MARLFCGPDKGPWVTVAHDSPQATVATFLEAVRRDDPQQVYRCLSESLCKERGLDGMVVAAAWDRLREQTPGLHLLGYAKAPTQPLRRDATACVFVLEVEGVRITLDVVRESYWELRYLGADGRVRESSTRLDEATYRSLVRAEEVEPDPVDDLPQARVGVAGRVAVHPGAAALDVAAVERLEVGREWKIAAIAAQKP